MLVLGKSNYKVGTGTGSVVGRICCTQCTVADTLKIPLLWYYVGQGLLPMFTLFSGGFEPFDVSFSSTYRDST